MNPRPLEFFAILDFEATCDAGRSAPKPQEVIEFPTIIFDNKSLEIVSEFSTFVKPTHHPSLTPFCTELTSITREDVADAPSFREVWREHIDWLEGQGLAVDDPSPEPSWAFLTCGDWDLASMLPVQLAACSPVIDELPIAYSRWINLKQPFASWARRDKAPGMAGMLRVLNLKLEGRHHRGIDDCRNIARIVRALRQSGKTIDVTSELSISRYPKLRVTLIGPDGTRHETRLKKRAIRSLRGFASSIFRGNPHKMTFKNQRTILKTDQDLLTILPTVFMA